MPSNNSETNHAFKLFLSKAEADLSNLIKKNPEVYLKESLYQPAEFEIHIHSNAQSTSKDDDDPWQDFKQFKMGDRISIGFAASNSKDREFNREKSEPNLFKGEITAFEADFDEDSKIDIIVRGRDISHRLYRGRHNRTFTNMTDTAILEDITRECGIESELEDSGKTHEHMYQVNQTNIEFLRERAAKIGFELFVQNSVLYFRQPSKESNEPLKLKWTTDFKSLKVRKDSAEQVESVEVRGWDYSQKRLISQTATNSKSIAFTNMKSPSKMPVVDQPIADDEEAREVAQAACNQIGGKYICLEAKADGNPEIRPGKIVELVGIGPYSGGYYVTETCHIYNKDGYSTEFSVCECPPVNLLSTSFPKTFPMVGIVTNNRDPKGEGRVKVNLPLLAKDRDTNWARVVSPGAGNNRGSYCLPEVDDEVFVAFEHGNINLPYILGGLWNGIDKTPEDINNTIGEDGKVRLRTIKTRTGHMIQFVEEGKSTGIYITTKENQCVYLNDSEGSIDITTSGKINLNAQGEFRAGVGLSGVELPSAINIEGKLPVNISSASGGINISSTFGPIDIVSTAMCPINISSSGGINLVSSSYITMVAPTINMASPSIVTEVLPVPNPNATAAAVTAAGVSTVANKPPIPPG